MGFKNFVRKLLGDDVPPSKITTDPSPPTVTEPKEPKKPRAPRKPKAPPPVVEQVTENPEKLAATAKGEPWVSVTGFELDLDNLNSGNFSLDWNEIFVAKLIRAGYKGKSDIDIVDQWFTGVCRDVVAENYEQYISDPTNRQ